LTPSKENIRQLYHGRDARARAFRFSLMAFDIASIIFFITSSLMRNAHWIYVADVLIALVILADLSLRIWITNKPARLFAHLSTWADIIVIVTLLLPMVIESYLFLRVLRALRLLRSYHMLNDLRQEFAFFRRNEEVVQSAINLLVFVFMMTALVYVVQVNINPKITNYIDALYFTITTLTTTGFGDITLVGTGGKLLSVVIMIVGVGLFLRLAQTIFRPARVAYECPDCGLSRHDADAVHCKHCGRVLHIETEGDT